jgi:hypothetical protein
MLHECFVIVRRIILLAMVALPAAAFGQIQDPREAQAQKDCVAGKPDAGVALLAELYAASGNPDFIYNQGRCYEAASRFVDAINRYGEYLRVAPNLSAEDRADAEKHIQECRVMQARLEMERERKAAAEAATAAAPPPPAPAPMAPFVPSYQPASAAPMAMPFAAPPGVDVSAQPKAEEPTPIYATWWFWTGLAAVVAGGVTAYVLATHHTTENACAGATIPCVATK